MVSLQKGGSKEVNKYELIIGNYYKIYYILLPL